METERELFFMKNAFHIGLHQDTCEPICFKFGLMLDTPKLYGMIPVKMTLTFSQGHRVMEKLKLVQSFCCKVACNNPNVHDSWICKRDDFK